MTDKPTTLSREEALLKRAQVLEELAAVYGAIAEGNVGSATAPAPTAPADDKASYEKELARLPLGEAILVYLRTCKAPQSQKQIWAALAAAGRETESPDPIRAISGALKKLLGKDDDLFHVRYGRWHLKSFYKSPYQKRKLQEILAKNLGTGGDPKLHLERTKAGIEAWRKRGGKPGAPVKMTPDVIERAKAMLRAGIEAKDVAKDLRVSKATLYEHKLSWRHIKPDPQPNESEDQRGSPFRLVASNE